MENGVEALKIASSVLIFVLAITITISVFTSATQALNRIFNMQDQDEYVKDAEGNYMNFIKIAEKGTREVGVETIVPSMYRAYKENYAIYFYNADGTKFILDDSKPEVNYIDLEKEVHISSDAAIEHINTLLHKKGLYEKLQEGSFIEKLGEYYMNDVWGETQTAEVNKVKKRLIVYTKK